MPRHTLYDCRSGYLRPCDGAGAPIKLGIFDATTQGRCSLRVWDLDDVGVITLAWRENGGEDRFGNRNSTEYKFDTFRVRIRRRSVVREHAGHQSVHVLFNSDSQGDTRLEYFSSCKPI